MLNKNFIIKQENKNYILFFYKFYNYITYYIKIEALYELNMKKLY